MANNKQLLAPDGAPQSNVRIKGVAKSVLLDVRLVAVPDCTLKIRAQDFNEEIHEKIDAPSKPTERPKLDPGFGSETREELLTMTKAVLLEMPELEHHDGSPGNKADIVDAILKVREEWKD